jgi:hypothetical protein
LFLVYRQSFHPAQGRWRVPDLDVSRSCGFAAVGALRFRGLVSALIPLIFLLRLGSRGLRLANEFQPENI